MHVSSSNVIFFVIILSTIKLRKCILQANARSLWWVDPRQRISPHAAVYSLPPAVGWRREKKEQKQENL